MIVFNKCEVVVQTFNDGIMDDSGNFLNCDLSSAQKADISSLNKAVEMRESLESEVFHLHPAHQEQLKEQLNIINSKNQKKSEYRINII